jgi:chloramphenicol-sensitive protein RarD
MKTGPIAAFGAYVLWGLLPLFWKQIAAVPAIETLCHRAIWAALLLVILLTVSDKSGWLQGLFSQPGIILTFVATSALLALNWFTYIWAVNHSFIVEASLGYFINPLFNVLLGVLFLKERLRSVQWLAILMAASGVLYMTVNYGRFPWVALTLAMTFGFYALLRKTARLKSLQGLTAEMLVMLVPALTYLFYLESGNRSAFGHTGLTTDLLLAATGIATAVPLLLFAYGARRVRLSTLGILQYVAPTLQFLLGVLVYQEDFPRARAIGFAVIWFALLIYSLESFFRYRHKNSVGI